MANKIRTKEVKEWILSIKEYGLIFFDIRQLKAIDEEKQTSLYRGGQYLSKAHNDGYIRQYGKQGVVHKWEIII